MIDKLGSINLFLKEDGSISADESYNAWGRPRNPVDWSNTNITYNPITDRGFTGHEHLNYFSLINMNGRMYDPTIGQFLSPDVFVQEPGNSQSFNRFSYCLNNPLKFVDPSGYLWLDDLSTHTDEFGHVVKVYDDGDLGVYKHKGNKEQALEEIENNYSSSNTAAGGQKMGVSWSIASFADYETFVKKGRIVADEKAIINFNSNWATMVVSAIWETDASIIDYFNWAASGHVWDIKKHAPDGKQMFGSLLFGRYTSAREAGNISAGGFAEKSAWPNFVFNYGYGKYNQVGNNKIKMGIAIAIDILTFPSITSLSSIYYSGTFGEDPLSRKGQELGKLIMRFLWMPNHQ